MRWRSAWPAASSLVLLLAACGGRTEPSLPTGYARNAEAQVDRAAALLDAGRPCPAVFPARRLQAETIVAINRHRVPSSLQEELLSRVNELAARARCGAKPPETAQAAKTAHGLGSWLRAHD
jgi:hypothetical protein